MFKLHEAVPRTALSHEDLFMQRYERLLDQACVITGQDEERAEDLVHDAFISVHTRPA